MEELFILDSCAFIAFFREEKGGEIVDSLFRSAIDRELKIEMHKVNLAEVYYDILRTSGEMEADKLFTEIKLLPIKISSLLDNEFIKLVGEFKINHKVSLADCFALALAKKLKASLVTSDHHEFDAIEKTRIVQFKWIR